MEDELLTPAEVAVALKSSSTGTVYRLVREGMLRSVKVGRGVTGDIRIPRSAVEELITKINTPKGE